MGPMTVSSFLDHYGRIRKRTTRLLGVVRPEHLDFAYKPGKFTVADQIRHIAAIERYLFAETLAGRKSCYQGCGPELAEGLENIIALVGRFHDESLEIIRGLSDEDLSTNCLTPAGAEVPRGKWLLLLAEHEIHHRAELYLYLNLMDVETPPIYGLTAEKVEELSIPRTEA
ncbi:MAG: DinB family protein [Candidatus Eisenbacteria bacterium]|uniref:DinB family protein n=1 Tax=Eiseniibacteriota bacterium TaxID=2212470 RepID=A0A956NI02_UNCEI|nr:DinB family protein [Candidatus Eisenbacteria bacterium]